MPAPRVTRAARHAESNAAFETVARAGYVANGLVHVLIGAIVLVVAFGGDAEGDQAGALKAVAGAPLGFVALWLIAVALCALGAWRAIEGLLARDRSGDAKGAAKKWGRRAADWGQAIVFAGLGLVAAAVASGARPDAEAAVGAASRGLLTIPGGSIGLGLVGIGIGVAGVAFVVMGVLRSFRNRVHLPTGRSGEALAGLGVAGFVAKGVALLIVGVLLIVAAVNDDAAAAGGLDGAMDALLNLWLGPALVAVVGAGFIAYGVFTVFRARYARM